MIPLSGDEITLRKRWNEEHLLLGDPDFRLTTFSGYLIGPQNGIPNTGKSKKKVRCGVLNFKLQIALFLACIGCSLDYVTLYCPENSTIQVEEAFYGRYATPCDESCCAPSGDDCRESMEETAPSDWSLLLQQCNNQSFCQFLNPGRALASCDAGQVTSSHYVIATYNCVQEGIQNNLIIHIIYFETRTVHIRYHTEKAISTLRAVIFARSAYKNVYGVYRNDVN